MVLLFELPEDFGFGLFDVFGGNASLYGNSDKSERRERMSAEVDEFDVTRKEAQRGLTIGEVAIVVGSNDQRVSGQCWRSGQTEAGFPVAQFSLFIDEADMVFTEVKHLNHFRPNFFRRMHEERSLFGFR